MPYSRGGEWLHARLEDVELQQPEIYEALMSSEPRLKNPVREVVVGPYAYGLWKSGHVRRRLVSIWKVQKWRAIPMEKHKPPERMNQTKLGNTQTEGDVA